MMVIKKIKQLLPFLILFSLLAILWQQLFYAKHNELPSPLIGKPLPQFKLPNLLMPTVSFTQENLKGKVSLLNVWATWCSACLIEHPMLMKIKNQYHVPIYSIAYKDDLSSASAWLAKHGNPYEMIGDDKRGHVAIDFGIYGTPETFVINREGNIVYKHIGVINQKTWDEVIYPLVKKYER